MATSIDTQLHQSETWTSADGESRRIDEMTERHLRNTIYLIERHGYRLLETEIYEYLFGPQPSGDMASYMFEQECAILMEMGPGEYVDELPVIEAMRKRLGEIEAERRAHTAAAPTPFAAARAAL